MSTTMTEKTVPPTSENVQETLDQARKLAGTINAAISRAVRLHANGEALDIGQVRDQARTAYEQLLGLLPRETDARQVLFSPIELMASYWDFQRERKALAATGFPTLNRALSGGLERDRLYVLLGAPGSGKTTLANQIADAVGRERAVLYVTSEDTPLTLLAKTIARRATIDYTAVLRGYESERTRIETAFADYRHEPQVQHVRYLDATQGIRLQEIANHAERHFAATRPSTTGDPLLIVDYLQRLVRAEDLGLRGAGGALGADARQAATVYTERLRVLACDLHCSVLCLSAMHRSSGYTNGGPNLLSAAKESGDIEYTADVLMGLGEQQEGTPGTLSTSGGLPWMLAIAKNRQGMNSSTGAQVTLLWRPMFQQFIECDEAADDAEQDERKGNGNGRYARRRGTGGNGK